MPKKFQFRLEQVLKIKSHYANLAKDLLNQVVLLRTNKESEINNQEEYRTHCLAKKVIINKASHLQTQWYHILHINDTIHQLEYEKKQLLEIENLRRRQLTAAMKEEKILEKLKDKKKLLHEEMVRHEETKILDEISHNKFLKKS